MIDPVLVSLVSAATALVASIAGPLVTLYVGRAQIRASVRSSNRQRWIDEFREVVSKFSGHIMTAAQVREKVIDAGHITLAAAPDYRHELELIVYTGTKIRMMINPLDPRHAHLIAELDGLLLRFRTAALDHDMQEDAVATIHRIIGASLVIIRDEWTKIQQGR